MDKTKDLIIAELSIAVFQKGQALKEIQYYLKSNYFNITDEHSEPPWYSKIKRILCQYGYKV